MKRADKKKNDFKRTVANFYNEYKYIFLAVGLIFITATAGIVWNLFDVAATRDFDLNAVLEDKQGQYNAEIIETTNGEDFVLVEGELEDQELIVLQRSLFSSKGDKIPFYLVEEGLGLNKRVHYSPGLIKRVEWSMFEGEEHHEVIEFYVLSSVKPDVTAVTDWDIRSEDSYLEDDLYVVKGRIAGHTTTVDKVAQMSGGVDMVYSINEENDKADFEEVLIHFESGDNDLYYHTNHKGILGESLYYNINVSQNNTEE